MNRRAALLVVVGTLGGIVVRGVAVWHAPLNSYAPDHLDTAAWSAYALEHGPLALYDAPKGLPVLVRQPDGDPPTVRGAPHAYNYPPLSAYLFWFQGLVWRWLDPTVQTVSLPPEAATPTLRLAETRAARFAQALPSLIADFALAVGVAALVYAIRRSDGRIRESAAYALTLLAPPIVLDSAYWNQTDAWVGVFLVWTLHAWLTDRLALSGVLWGVGLMLKPQAILLAPWMAFVFLARRFSKNGSWTLAWRMRRTVAALIVTVAAIAAPFSFADRAHPDGLFRWFDRSYVATIDSKDYAKTTLNAFNVWWLHWIAGGATPQHRDSTVVSLGLRRDAWGQVALASAVILAGFLAARQGRWARGSWLSFTFAVCLAAFVFPTRVHERYIYYGLPFLCAMTCLNARLWWPVLTTLLIVGTCEMTSFRWVNVHNEGVVGWTVCLALGTIAAFVYTLVALARRQDRRVETSGASTTP